MNEWQDSASVVEPETAIAVSWQRQSFGAQLQRAALSAEAQRRAEWIRLIGDWLELKRAKSGSGHTERNYRNAIERWQLFLATQFIFEEDGTARTCELWEVDHTHVRTWQQALLDDPNIESENTVNHYLSCVSSFYSFVIRDKRMVNGVEIDLFTDRLGRARINPFKAGNLQRARTESYSHANPLTVGEYARLLDYLEERNHTVSGARNHALILTYLHTGWRSAELLRMQWKDVRPSAVQKGTFIFAWKGKGGKAQDDVLPEDCYNAIVNFLKLAGRWTPGAPGREDGLAPDEFVWLPVRAVDMRGMNNGAAVDMSQPISEKQALRVLRAALKGAGVPNPDSFRVHDLRHTHARFLKATGQHAADIQARLHHSSLATTGLYLGAICREDPEDTHTRKFAQLRLTA